MANRTLESRPPAWSDPGDQTALSLQLQVITPMFGGGYEPREVDMDNPIRAASVRGHLRFWWRAIYGAQYDSSEELFKAEEALWGSASKAGNVRLTAAVLHKGVTEPCAEYSRRSNGLYGALPTFRPGWPPYALQPFQGKATGSRVEQMPAEALTNASFEILLAMPTHQYQAVADSVTAWIRYGGIGARTRRGCGSLTVVGELPRHEADVRAESRGNLTLLGASRYVMGGVTSDPIRAWWDAVQIYRDFRQQEGFARNKGTEPNRPGRSLWPEPDTIRRITGDHSSLHSPTHPVQQGFPRADLGLPIIFHFKDSGDPTDATLEGPGDGQRRFASPVITKALQVGRDQYQPLVLVLNAPHVWHFGNLTLDCPGGGSISRDKIELSGERGLVSPMGGQPVREALLRFVSSRWGSKVEALS